MADTDLLTALGAFRFVPIFTAAVLCMCQPSGRLDRTTALNSRFLRISPLLCLCDLLIILQGYYTLRYRLRWSHRQSAQWLVISRLANFDNIVDDVPAERIENVRIVTSSVLNTTRTRNFGIQVVWGTALVRLLVKWWNSGALGWFWVIITGMYMLDWLANEVLMMTASRGSPEELMVTSDDAKENEKQNGIVWNSTGRVSIVQYTDQKGSTITGLAPTDTNVYYDPRRLDSTFRKTHLSRISWLETFISITKIIHVWAPFLVGCIVRGLWFPDIVDFLNLLIMTSVPPYAILEFIGTMLSGWWIWPFMLAMAGVLLFKLQVALLGDRNPVTIISTTDVPRSGIWYAYMSVLCVIYYISAPMMVPMSLICMLCSPLLFAWMVCLILASVVWVLGICVDVAGWVIVPVGLCCLFHQIVWMALNRQKGWVPWDVMVGQDDRVFVVNVLLGVTVGYVWWFDLGVAWNM